MSYRLRDVRKSSYRAVPVSPYLGARAAGLKPRSESFDPLREPLDRRCRRRIVGRRRGQGLPIPGVVKRIAEHQRGVEQLPGLAEAAKGFGGVACLSVDEAGDFLLLRLLPVAAGDRIAPPGHFDIHHRHQLGSAEPSTESIRAIAPSTVPRSF